MRLLASCLHRVNCYKAPARELRFGLRLTIRQRFGSVPNVDLKNQARVLSCCFSLSNINYNTKYPRQSGNNSQSGCSKSDEYQSQEAQEFSDFIKNEMIKVF